MVKGRFKLIHSISLPLLLAMVWNKPLPAAEDAGIELGNGFQATIFADDVGYARHMTVAENGDVYVALNSGRQGKGIVALRDTDGNGTADQRKYFGDVAGTGIALHDGYLYFGADNEIVRWRRQPGELVPGGRQETVVSGFPPGDQHMAKSITLDERGNLYVNVGAPSNACQVKDRTPGSPGQKPCPLLEQSAGVWRYDAGKTGQQHPDDGERYVTGVRNAVALEWNEPHGALYLVQHGRDQLDSMFPQHYTAEERISLPAEEFHRVEGGSNLGWPYTYWDPQRDARMVAPEYGGDGETVSDDPEYQKPLIGFPAHWGPNDLLFYTGDAFPRQYKNGAFIAFHGSWNRQPQQQDGYQVVFVPMGDGGEPAGEWSTIADGFAGKERLMDSGNAKHRPTGLAQGPDGALYISDSVGGRIWRITSTGD